MIPVRTIIYTVIAAAFLNTHLFTCPPTDTRIFLDEFDESSAEEIRLVDIKEHNPAIIVDMKYTTCENYAGKPISAETKCLVTKQVMDKLNHVQAELEQQSLGLKVFEGFRPLYVETALLRQGRSYKNYNNKFRNLCVYIGLFSHVKDLFYPPVILGCPELPLSNMGVVVSVTLVTCEGKELAMPTKFDDRSKKTAPDYYGMDDYINAHKKLLAEVMTKHGFKQGSAWYEFCDNDLPEYYYHYLYARHTTASHLTTVQKQDMRSISNELVNLVFKYAIEPYLNRRC